MKRRHVLVVEDECSALTLIEKMLVGAGYRVTGVPDGIAALKVSLADPPDLAIIDLVISGVDGCGVCALLKRSSGFHAPIVVLSGRTTAKDVDVALGAGADAVLPKPVDRAALLARASQLLNTEPKTGPGSY